MQITVKQTEYDEGLTAVALTNSDGMQCDDLIPLFVGCLVSIGYSWATVYDSLSKYVYENKGE